MEVKLQETHEFTLLNRCFNKQDELLTQLGGKTRQEKKLTMFRNSKGVAEALMKRS